MIANRPIVILGMPRSGTTLLKEMLNHHGQIAIPPESYFIPSLWRRYRMFRDPDRLVSDLESLPQLDCWGIHVNELRTRVTQGTGFAEIIASLYGLYALNHGKRRFGDKTPAYLENIRTLDRAFPAAQYVHIIRDGRDAALSYQEMDNKFTRGLGFPTSVTDFACRWSRAVKRARQIKEAHGSKRFREVRYESLIADPEHQLRNLCDFLETDFDPQMLLYHEDRTGPELPNHPRLKEPPGPGTRNWREQMAPRLIESFEAIAGNLLSELGYDRFFPSPSKRARALGLLAPTCSDARIAVWHAVSYAGAVSPFWRSHQVRRFARDASAERTFGSQNGKRVSSIRVLIYAIDFVPLVGGEERYLMRLSTELTRNRPTSETDEMGIRCKRSPRIRVRLITRTPAGDFDDSSLPFAVLRQPSIGLLLKELSRSDVIHLSGPVLLPLILAHMMRKRIVITHHLHHAACPNGMFFHYPTNEVCPGHFNARKYLACLGCVAADRGWIHGFNAVLQTFPRRWLCQRAASNIMVSRDEGRRLDLANSKVIYHSIPEPELESDGPFQFHSGRSAGSPFVPSFAYVGRLVREKGTELILRAVADITGSGYNCNLKVIGDGPQRLYLENLTATLGIAQSVHFAGFIHENVELLRLLADVRAVIAPSLCVETAGLSVIEHMKRGGLVIVSNEGAMREIVGDAGLTFPHGDIDALANCLRQVLDNPQLVYHYGEMAKRRAAEKFSGTRDIREHLKTYIDLIG